MPYQSPDQWEPVDVASLEPSAEQVVRSNQNTLVIAGPGAGKTELLAQRACYLLDTGICFPPYRILAISFKRDAAKNLDERVKKRCGDNAGRFDSFTLDSFAKGIVDRFLPALNEEWRPSAGYEVLSNIRNEEMRLWLTGAGVPHGHNPIDFGGHSNNEIKRIFDGMAHGYELPYSDPAIGQLNQYWGQKWWREQLARPVGSPSLSFPMLNRLAAYLLRCNPKLVKALRETYKFVFLDEFQDTTAAQYDLIRAAFLLSTAILTAVGDSKQRIMLWAGAMQNIFDVYHNDFGADINHLIRNYRSAPELVQMQHVIAQALEDGTPAAEPANYGAQGSCTILEFGSPEDEAIHLANLIEAGIYHGLRPRDFCVLVRQLTGNMIPLLKTALSERGIPLRDESQLQDLLAEPVVRFLLSVFRLATRQRDAEAWDILTSDIVLLFGFDEYEDAIKVEKEAVYLLRHAKNKLSEGRPIAELPTEIVALVGEGAFRTTFRQYRNGSFLNRVLNDLAEVLQNSIVAYPSPYEAVNDVIGTNVVPAMTIHKSKGLEFHTIIFLGLEDSQWWAFANQADEEKRGFFVAFSRAEERVFFTFSDVRDGRWGRRTQNRAQIGDLYTILQQAGVPTEDHRQ